MGFPFGFSVRLFLTLLTSLLAAFLDVMMISSFLIGTILISYVLLGVVKSCCGMVTNSLYKKENAR